MRFLVDRCAGRRLAAWLREQAYDVLDASDEVPDPGDLPLLRRAHDERRVLVTMDKDFGDLMFLYGAPRVGLLRLPHCPSAERIRVG